MATSFTLRDFFVYLLTGLIFVISTGIIFYNELLSLTVDFLAKYQFIKDFSWLMTILIIPTIYLTGHIIGALTYWRLQLFVKIYWGFKKYKVEIPEWKYKLLMFVQILLYRQSVAFAVSKFMKNNEDKPFNSDNEFWMLCAKLQIKKIYSPAEYWYLLNELFNSVNLAFCISTIIAFIAGNWILGVIYLLLTIFAFKRAMQYADFFVRTVVRLTIAEQTTQLRK